MAEGLFDEVRRYLEWNHRDEAMLAALAPRLAPHVPAIVDRHYERILAHEQARTVITGGEAQIERLRGLFETWLHECLRGPHDEPYFEGRARIGRAHVEVGLGQRYMVTAMSVLGRELTRAVCEVATAEELPLAIAATRKILDIDLAIMLSSYQDSMLERMARAERLATIGQLGAGIGHELRNPLSVISSSAYLLRKRVEGDERAQKHLEKIERHVDMANGIVSDLLGLVRNTPPKRVPLSLREIVQAAIEAAALADTIEVQDRCEGSIVVHADRGQMIQVLRNLLSNASDAMSGRGLVVVRSEAREDGTAIIVEDEGPGFPETLIARIFEPLVTTKASGVGLGLPLARQIAGRHGGSLHVANRPEGGARVVMIIRHPEPEPAS